MTSTISTSQMHLLRLFVKFVISPHLCQIPLPQMLFLLHHYSPYHSFAQLVPHAFLFSYMAPLSFAQLVPHFMHSTSSLFEALLFIQSLRTSLWSSLRPLQRSIFFTLTLYSHSHSLGLMSGGIGGFHHVLSLLARCIPRSSEGSIAFVVPFQSPPADVVVPRRLVQIVWEIDAVVGWQWGSR